MVKKKVHPAEKILATPMTEILQCGLNKEFVCAIMNVLASILASVWSSKFTTVLHNCRHIFNNCWSVCENSTDRVFHDFLSVLHLCHVYMVCSMFVLVICVFPLSFMGQVVRFQFDDVVCNCLEL